MGDEALDLLTARLVAGRLRLSEATTAGSSRPGTWSRWGCAVPSTSPRRPSPHTSGSSLRPRVIPSR